MSTPDGPQAITAIAKETHAGAYHLVTPSGAYYVDGIAASTYVAYIPHAAWKIFGDGYITLRYQLGVPIVPEGRAPVTLFWLLDALKAVSFFYATKAGISIGSTLSRKKRSPRNRPAPTSAARSRFVVAMSRTSTVWVVLDPTRSKLRS